MNRKWIIGIGMAVATLCFYGCSNEDNCIRGEGTTVTKELGVGQFTGLDIQGTTNVKVTQGEQQKVVAIGHPNIIEKVSTQVSDGVWEIFLEGNCFTDYELNFEVELPQLDRVEISGTGNFMVDDFEKQGDLDLAISGTGNIELNRFDDCENLVVGISSSGNVQCHEHWDGLKHELISISGSGSFLAFPLVTQNCDISISASGACQVNVEEYLDVSLSGSGSVQYIGNPEVESSISGSGVVQHVN